MDYGLFEVLIMLVRLKQDFIGSSAGKVLDVSEVDARTLLERSIADPAGDDALSPVITKAMEAAMTKVSDSVGQIIDTTLKRFQEAQEQAHRNSVPAIFGAQGDRDLKRNICDWLRHAITATTGKPHDAMQAADYLNNTYKHSSFQTTPPLA